MDPSIDATGETASTSAAVRAVWQGHGAHRAVWRCLLRAACSVSCSCHLVRVRMDMRTATVQRVEGCLWVVQYVC